MLSKTLGTSRFLIVVAVLGSLLAATTLLVYGLVENAQLTWTIIEAGKVSRKGAKALALDLVDLFLLGTVFFIGAVGLKQLFNGFDINVLAWLTLKTLDDLKNKMITVAIAVLGAMFLKQVVS